MATKKELIFESYLDSFCYLAHCDCIKALEPAVSGSHPVQQASGFHGTAALPRELCSKGQ